MSLFPWRRRKDEPEHYRGKRRASDVGKRRAAADVPLDPPTQIINPEYVAQRWQEEVHRHVP